MQTEDQKRLKFNGINIFSVNFLSKKPSIGEKSPIHLDVEPQVFFEEDGRRFRMHMVTVLGLPEFFDLRIEAIGYFELEAEEKEDVKRQLVNLNATAIMFPYIRSFITSFTSQLGNVTGPLVLPPQFFKGDVQEIRKMLASEGTEAKGRA